MDHHSISTPIARLLRICRYGLAIALTATTLLGTTHQSGAQGSIRRNLYGASSQLIYLPIVATAWPFTAIIVSRSAPRFIPVFTINGRFENLGSQTYDHFAVIVNLVDARPQPHFDTITITATTALSYSLPGQPVYFSTKANWPISDPPPEFGDISVFARISEAHVTTATVFALTTVLTQSKNLGNALRAYAEFRNDTPYVLTDTWVSFANLGQLSGIDAMQIGGPIQPGQIVSATGGMAFSVFLTNPNPFFEVFAQGRPINDP